MKPVSIVTPTGDRPEALTLLSKYIERQDYPEPIQWIVVDDGNTPFEPPKPGNVELTYVRRTPSSKSVESLPANLRLGLTHVKHPWIAVLEDDDWYGESYLSKLLPHLEDNDLVGERQSFYYNVRHRLYRQLQNRHHASLCCTAFTKELTPFVLRATKGNSFVDKRLWNMSVKRRKLIPPTQQQVGIKGVPGRYGLGMGHAPDIETWTPDCDWEKLAYRIGPDVEAYKKWYRYNFPELFQHAVVPIAGGKPWLVIGKGPTWRSALDVDLTKYHTIGLNHVCAQVSVDFAHMVDIECVWDLGEALDKNCRFLVIPYWPNHVSGVHRSLVYYTDHSPVLTKLAKEGRLLTYWHTQGVDEGRPKYCPLIPIKAFGFEGVVWLLRQMGVRVTWTAGVDGGTETGEEFQHIVRTTPNPPPYTQQFEHIANAGMILKPLETS